MPFLLLLSGVVLVVGLTVALRRWGGTGRRLRLGPVRMHYTPPVTADEARRASEYLVRQKYATDARLERDGASYRLRLMYPAGQAGEGQDVACEVLAAGLSDDVLAGAAVEVRACDARSRPLAAAWHRGRFGRRITMNAAYLFYRDGVTDGEALSVAAFLAGAGLFNDSPKFAQLDRHAGGYEFRLAVEVDPLAPELVAGAGQMAADLTRVLGGAPVTVRYCDGLLGTLRASPDRAAGDDPPSYHVPGGPYRSQTFQVPKGPSVDLAGPGDVKTGG